MKRQKLIDALDQWRTNSTNVRFSRLCTIAEALGFELKRQTGSHKVYALEGVREILNLQNDKGRAKPYQVEQFIKLVDKYKLLEGENDV